MINAQDVVDFVEKHSKVTISCELVILAVLLYWILQKLGV
jgi:hypothetical protein